MSIKAPKGTKDVLPNEAYKWQFIEKTFKEVCEVFGFSEIRTPVFEHTELFERGVGDTTDVVQKEMYTFLDKGNRSITLRPEGTAGVVRSYLENNIYAEAKPTKLFYNVSCYRYEKPQAGRLREFHQLGVECFGSKSPYIDAEIISLANEFFARLKIKNIALNINSIGCPKCREHYNEALKNYLSEKLDTLCETCKDRFNKNPLRILDCKSKECESQIKNAPILLDFICTECSEHFNFLQSYLKIMNIDYKIDNKIVRGLDYYTKTVFEFVSEDLGAKSTVCGGGRYDGLVLELGGEDTPSIGFGLGIERLLLIIENQGIEIKEKNTPIIYIANIGEIADLKACEIVLNLRKKGIYAEKDTMGKSLKAQMKYADKIGFLYTICLGENEINEGIANIKNMKTGEIKAISIENIENYIKGKGAF